ncbi:MAG TPA: thermonuclease family protein [Blastocatellia bacterium]|nr:thermonuclease family protein [Blastocatellia bacterium]
MGIYVGLAVVAGFALGLATSRFLATPVTAPDQSAGRSGQRSESTTAPVGGRHKVTHVMRADTIELEGLGQVRLLGVESPEGKSPEQIYLSHGRNALAFTQKSLAGQEVRVEFDPSTTAGNSEIKPAYVYTVTGLLFNSELVRQGHAFVRANEQCQLSEQLRSAEREAMQAMRGVWGIADGSAVVASLPTVTTPAGVESATDKNKKLRPLMPSEIAPASELPAAPALSSEPIVFVSASDRQYHKEGCEYLAKKSQSVALSKAKADGYGACGRCFASTVLKAP